MTNDNTVSIEEITSIQAESARLQREVLSMQKENALEMQEISRRFVETDRKFVETDRKFAETKVYLDQVLARADKVFAMAGNLTNNIGDVAEEFFYQGLSTSMALGGMHFDMIDRRIKNHVGTLQGEYDLVLYNGNSVALVEVKHKLHPNDVDRFANKALPNFRPLFPAYADHRIYGAVAALSVPEEAVERAMANGLGILTQAGEDMRLLNPPGFSLRCY